jgi:hypothetical protein
MARRSHAYELLGDRLGDQLGVELGALDFADVHLHRRAGDLVKVLAQRVHFGTGLADDDARTGGVDVHGDFAAALDRDVGQAGMRELVFDVVADREVLHEQVCELLFSEPVGLPVVDVADSEAFGMIFVPWLNFLGLRDRRGWSSSR